MWNDSGYSSSLDGMLRDTSVQESPQDHPQTPNSPRGKWVVSKGILLLRQKAVDMMATFVESGDERDI